MSRLNLFLLGAPRVELHGQNLKLERRKLKALLCFLAVTGTSHARESLATLFWPEHDHVHAHGSLRRHLSELGLLLGSGWVDGDREQVGLRAEADLWLDVRQFQAELTACQTHNHAGHEACADCILPLTHAVALYRDAFLAGFTLPDCPAFDEWQFFQAEALRQTFTSVLQRLVQAHVQEGQLDSALPYARRWVHVEPLEEQAHRQLIQLYAQSGQQAAALRQYERCRQLLMDELGVGPAPETTELYAHIRKHQGHTKRIGQALAAAPVPRHNLPAETTPFIGRTQELEDVLSLLHDPAVRLVTIIGLGGIGKTRLALAAAARHLDARQEQTVFVALGPLMTVDNLVIALADALEFAFQPDGRAPDEQLLDYLRPKQLLLVLDNFEHLLAGVGFVHAVLQAAPGVHILATSRERLQLSEEAIYALSGMSFQNWQSVDDAHAQDAVQLFVQAARRVKPHFALTAQDVPAVAKICRGVGGMPLGILLAAAWIDLLTPDEIAGEINHGLNILQTELRDVPERQRSIAAVFEHTWQQLGETERSALMRLALFRGGFTRTAAQTVAAASLTTLGILSRKSLVQREANGRYTMHELLRQFAASKLFASGAVEDARCDYSHYFVTFLAQHEPDLKGPRQRTAFAEIESDFDNIRQAWQWLDGRQATPQLAQALESLAVVFEWYGRVWEAVGTFSQISEQLTRCQADPRLLAVALVWHAHFRRDLGGHVQAHANQLLQQSLALLDSPAFAALDTRFERAMILKGLADLAHDAADRQEASLLYDQCLSHLRELGERWWQARVLLVMEGVQRNLHGLGSAEQHQQQAESAKQLVLESLAIFRELGDEANVAASLVVLGITHLTLGQPNEARLVLEEALVLCQDLGARNETFANVIGYLGVAKEFLGEYAQVQEHGQVLLAIAHETGYGDVLRLGNYLSGIAALAQNDYIAAEKWLAQSVALGRVRERKAQLAYDLTSCALASYRLGNWHAAQQQILESLEIAINIRTIRAIVHGLLLAALLLADRAEHDRAVELYALAYSFPFVANSRWCHDLAGRQLAAIAGTLPLSAVAAAQQRGRTRDVWQTARDALVWLREANH